MILYDEYDTDRISHRPPEWTTDRLSPKCIKVYSIRHTMNRIHKKAYTSEDLVEIAQTLCYLNGIRLWVKGLLFNDDVGEPESAFLLCLNKPQNKPVWALSSWSRICYLRYYPTLIEGRPIAALEMEGDPFEEWLTCFIEFRPEKEHRQYEPKQ